MLPYMLGRRAPTKAAAEVPALATVHDAMGGLPHDPNPAHCWTALISSAYEMLGNDEVGDCGIVGPAQIIRTATAANGQEIIPTTAAVMAEYSAISGYSPANPASDVGVYLTDVLERWKAVGLDVDGSGRKHKILGYLKLDPRNRAELEWSTIWFGACLLGHNLTKQAMSDPITWEVTTNPADQVIVGGHCTAAFRFTVPGLDNLTWGQFRLARPAFDNLFLEEAYAVLPEDWVLPQGLAPSGFSRAELEDRLKNLASLAR